MDGKRVKITKEIRERKKETIKIIFNRFDEKSKKVKPIIGIIYYWDKKILIIGGFTKYEYYIREIIKSYFKGLVLIPDSKRKRVRKVGNRWMEEFKNKIKFKSVCKNYQFKLGFKKMEKAKLKKEIDFLVVPTIGRIFN